MSDFSWDLDSAIKKNNPEGVNQEDPIVEADKSPYFLLHPANYDIIRGKTKIDIPEFGLTGWLITGAMLVGGILLAGLPLLVFRGKEFNIVESACLLIGLALAIFGIYLTFYLNRERKLAIGGKIIYGKLLKTSGAIINQNYKIETTDLRGSRFRLWVKYEFVNEAGKRIVGKSSVEGEFHNGRQHQPAGKPVAVLYLNPHNYKLL